jgi:hypothetical protein
MGQLMFSPASIAQAPNPNDRPWGGWLYVGSIAQKDVGYRRDTLEVDVGILGGSMSLAKWTQTTWHEIIHSAKPAWNHNLKNEPAIFVDYKVAVKIPLGSRADYIPHLGANIGNVTTSAYAGGTLRIGCNLTGYGPQPLRPSDTSSGQRQFQPMSGQTTPYGKGCGGDRLQEAYFFMYGEARYVAFNAFLDGNMFRDSPSVDKKPFVADIGIGLSTRYRFKSDSKRDFRVTYSIIKRSKEFDIPPGIERSTQLFGSIVFSRELR